MIGNISIGHDSKIGASASILHDLPPNSVVVGHKGIVIQKRGLRGSTLSCRNYENCTFIS